MSTEHIATVFRGRTSQEAIDAAKAWAKAEGMRVRTVARVTQRFDLPVWAPEGPAWQITLAVDADSIRVAP